jgi:CO dehydrogenase maturation factor
MKIAISGKGGSGKTTLAATMAHLFARRGFPVLAIDGDPNPNLGMALGLAAPGLQALQPLPRAILEQRTDPSGATEVALAQPIEAIASQYGVATSDDITLLLGAQVDHAGAG